MGLSKTALFTKEQNNIAQLARALAHPARVAIVEYILRQEGCICGDIVEEVGLAQATVSQHLKVLKDSGVIKGTINGAAVCYCINTATWNTVGESLTDIIQNLKSSKCC